MGKLFLAFAWKLNHYKSDKAPHTRGPHPIEALRTRGRAGGTHCRWLGPQTALRARSTVAASVQERSITQTFPEGWAVMERLESGKDFLPPS